MSELDVAIAERARSQHGIFTLAQARAVGMSRKAMRTRLRSGRWAVVHPGVLRVEGTPLTWEARALAACMTSELGLGSHLTAAHLWTPDGFGPVGLIDVTVPRHLVPRSRSGVRYHESLACDLAGATKRRGIPVTGPARTVLDVCAVVDDFRALASLDEARRRQLASWPELWECLVLHARRGRNGIVRFRGVLDKRWGRNVPSNEFARLVERLFEDAGLPEPVHEFGVTVSGHHYRIDLAYPELLIAIELDGRHAHDNERSFDEDPIRRNRLEVAGWMVLNITWRRLVEDPAGVVADVRAAILLRSGV
jgi:Transcriptional regulator, AbiEi antitoxin/Protein of unknown function (DUF559)